MRGEEFDVKRMIVVAILAMLTGACSAGQDHAAKQPLTEAQRDSVLSRSELPGAGVIGHAMSASGAEQKHANAMNALSDTLPH